jgi:mannitol-specific phosphotransferase system IIBC component
MAVVTSTVIAGIGLALGAAGAATQYLGNRRVAKASKQQERVRQKQMNLDIARKRREAIRKMLVARATGVSNAANQGASLSDSAVQGGISQAVQSANISSSELSQNADLGGQMFSANALEASGRGLSSFGGALSSWGSGLIQNSTQISRVGAGFGLWKNAY